MPDISLGTVYRNLNLLRDKGEVLELNFSRPYSRFDGRIDNHCHFMCNICGSIFDFNQPVYVKLDHTIAQKGGFKILRHYSVFEGLCANCRKSD